MVGFKESTEEYLVREKEYNMLYFTRKTQQSHVGYMTFNRPQYGRYLSLYKCLICIQLPPTHKKASLA